MQATVNHKTKGASKEFFCTTKNISSHGAFLLTNKKLDTGVSLAIQFDIPAIQAKGAVLASSKLVTTGIVTRCVDDGLAIRFEKSCQISPVKETSFSSLRKPEKKPSSFGRI